MSKPVISEGPRTLPLMPASQQAVLDPYMALIVGYRKSGLSLNHIIGCPLDCGYCVRHFWGNFEVKTPHLLCPDEQAVDLLTSHHAFQPHTTPIQLLNKATDPFLPGVRPHLFRVLHALDQRGYTNHVLIITRFTVTAADMDELETLRHLRVTLLFTYSGITDPRIEPIAKSRITVTSIRTACARKQRTGVVLYWRPIVPGWNDDPATMAHVLATGHHADAIVFTGYYHKPENDAYLREQGVTLPYGQQDYHRRKAMPAELDAAVIAAWRASGISTPLFRKTSCGVAFAHAAADYNGHWGVREICDICPVAQQQRCADEPPSARRRGHGPRPRPARLPDALPHRGRPRPGPTAWASSAATPSSTRSGSRSGNWTSRIYLHAHGRAPLGHALDPAQAAAFDWAPRTRFTAQARYTDE